MEDVVNLLQKNVALESENASLKQLIETINAEKNALDQTLVELLKANIGLKAHVHLQESKSNKFIAEVKSLKEENAKLEQSLKLVDSTLETSASANMNCS